MKNPRSIAITGASSGIGAALAQHYAAPDIILWLCGRNEERLRAVAGNCEARGAHVHMAVVDVTDAAAVEAWLLEADAQPLDLLIANAGVSGGSGSIHGETSVQARRIFRTNVDGVLNSVLPLLPRMRARGRGQIALMSSLASFRGLPTAPAYSASKALVRTYGEGLRGWLGSAGVAINVICPGYIRTAMTARNPFPMPFLMDADKAARIIAEGLAENKARIAFPWQLYLPVLWLSYFIPLRASDAIFSRFPSKPASEEDA